MRISDWSSDVCSSDLRGPVRSFPPMGWNVADVKFHALHAGHVPGSDPECFALFVRIHESPDLYDALRNHDAHAVGRRPVARAHLFEDPLSDRLVLDGSGGDGSIALRRAARSAEPRVGEEGVS